MATNHDDIGSVVCVGLFVPSAVGFTSRHLVANGSSQLLGEVLGPGSVHARAAVGVARLPLDAPVEVEAMLTVANSA